MAERNRDDDRRRKRLDRIDVGSFGGLELPETDLLADLGGDFQGWIGDAKPDPADIEATLSGLSLPDGTEIDVDAEVIPDAGLDGAEVDRVVETSSQAVELAVDGSGEAGTVLVDTGGEVVEIAIEGGGEAAVEATGEIVAAALDGV
jgi:hypothetical protein